jgi:hypothetical protein
MVYRVMVISLYHFKGKDTSFFVFLSFKPDSREEKYIDKISELGKNIK